MKSQSIKKIILMLFVLVALVAVCAVTASAEDYGNFSYSTFEPEGDESFESYNAITRYSADDESTETVVAIPDVIEKTPITTIAASAFSGNSSLTEVIIPDTVTYIENAAFLNCTALQVVVIPKSVTEIGDSAFQGCTSLKYVVFSDGIKHIGDLAFKDCTALEYLDLGDTVETIGNGAFFGCTSLKNVYVPTSVSLIGEQAFSFCQNGNLTKQVDGFAFYADNAVKALDNYINKQVITGYEGVEGATGDTAMLKPVYASFAPVAYVTPCADSQHEVKWTLVREATDSYEGLELGQCTKCFRISSRANTDVKAADAGSSALVTLIICLVLCAALVIWIVVYVKKSKVRRAKAIAEYKEKAPADEQEKAETTK